MVGREDLCNELFVRGIDRTAPASQMSASPRMALSKLVVMVVNMGLTRARVGRSFHFRQ